MNSHMDIIDDKNRILKVLSSSEDMNENIVSYSNPNLPISTWMEAEDETFINVRISFKAVINSIQTGNQQRNGHLKNTNFF